MRIMQIIMIMPTVMMHIMLEIMNIVMHTIMHNMCLLIVIDVLMVLSFAFIDLF